MNLENIREATFRIFFCDFQNFFKFGGAVKFYQYSYNFDSSCLHVLNKVLEEKPV